MFLQSIMVAARARGLDTCPQAAFTQYHQVIGKVLGLPENETVVCGMALGVADMTKIENSLITDRMPIEEFVKFVD
jgi:nitroreductase